MTDKLREPFLSQRLVVILHQVTLSESVNATLSALNSVE